MDRYKYATVFETLAVKIVDAVFDFHIDFEKSHTTSRSHDQGIDAVIFLQNDDTHFNRTIEAKLRNPKYTLGLKDIASSLIFFLIRKGDEHYIVSNVYLTEGTIQVLNDLNLSQGTSLFYVDGEATKTALLKIKNSLSGEELFLAEALIKEFSQLKSRARNKPKQTVNIENNEELLFPSRQKILEAVESLILDKTKLINISGRQGVGKSVFLNILNQRILKNSIKVIKIDTESYNTIPMVCYEIASTLLGIQVNELFKQISFKTDINYEDFNPGELEQVSFLFRFFDATSNFSESAIYIALKGLNEILKVSKNKKILIELENFSLTSEAVFDFFKQISFSLPDNVQILTISRTDMVGGLFLSDSGFEYIHQNEYVEYSIAELTERDSVQFLLSQNTDLDERCAKAIYDNVGGIPGRLDYINKRIAAEKVLLLSPEHVHHFFLGYHLYSCGIEMLSEETSMMKLFFLLLIFENRLKSIDIEQFTNIGYFAPEETTVIALYLNQSELFCKKDGFISFERKTDFWKIEEILKQKYDELQRILLDFQIPEKVVLSPLGQIIWAYIKNSYEVFTIYSQFESSWEYKSNTDWKLNALSYIVSYIMRNHFYQLDDILNNISYLIEYLDLCIFEENHVMAHLSTEVQKLVENFYTFEEETKEKVSNTLARYVFLQYHQHRKKSEKELQKKTIENAINSSWYPFTALKEKIILHRYQMLQFKTLENKQVFYDALDEFYIKFRGDPYAETVYYANKAAQYYAIDTRESLKCLFCCPLEKLLKQYPEEKRLALWIENDIALCYVVSKKTKHAAAQLTTCIEENKRFSYNENLARSYNLLGLVALLQGDQSHAEKYFHQAVCYSYDSNLDAFFHFTINYLTYCSLNDEKFINLIMGYLNQRHHEISEHLMKNKRQNNRWYISLTAFQEILARSSVSNLEKFRSLFNGIEFDISQVNGNYFIKGSLFVVF